ncbi:MAG: hypothetical protein JNK15_21335 [Planctomycetes bacterium]|nr:hypothetical protein [Planctomycetota bacterium]
MTTPPKPGGIAATYVLGIVFVGLVVALWLRGLGRVLIPVLLLGAAAYGLHRLVKAIKAPVD